MSKQEGNGSQCKTKNSSNRDVSQWLVSFWGGDGLPGDIGSKRCSAGVGCWG